MEDVEHYPKTLIDVKEQYQINVKKFANVAQLSSNNMPFGVHLGLQKWRQI
jgi:hypothetical protein